MKKIVLCILLMLGSLPILKSENVPMPQDEPQDRIFSFFSDIESRHEEKLWLHLDKPYYAAGDTIWFRAYLSDAATLRPDTLSNFIYVDLFDRRNKLISSKKIKRDSIGFANNLCLSDTLAAGEYTLQAYTGWMLNFDPSCFFQKNILIGRTASDIHTDVTYTDKDMMVIRFSDKSGTPLSGTEASFELYDKSGKRLSSGQQPTSPSGALFITLPTDSTLNGAYAETRLKLGNGTVYKRTFFPEPRTASFDIQFLPEGGNLVPGTPQIVAFKSVQSNGYPAEVSGVILNPAGDTVARFSSEHDGMGTFLLTPQQGENYRAVSLCDTLSMSTLLPIIHDNACAMTVTQSGNNLRYRILGTVPQGSMLVAHTRGLCHFVHPVTPDNPEGLIKTDSLPEGILHLLLADSTGIPKTERLVYLSRPQEQWQVMLDKPSYGKREKVRIGIAVKKDGQPLAGDFSVSVTDANMVKTDSLSENIHTDLLLTSDLKGYIHNPGYYFLDDSPARRHYLDLVMLTHGWKRFGTENLFRPEPFDPKHYVEYGQYISGHVKKLFGRDAAEATVTALGINRENVIGNATADSTGHFTIEGLDFQDTTVFLVSARTRNNKPVQTIDLDSIYQKPLFVQFYPFPLHDQLKARVQKMSEYLQTIKNKFNTTDSIKEFDIEEVIVTATNPRKPFKQPFGELYDTTTLVAFKKVPLYNYLSRLPGVSVTQDFFSLKKIDSGSAAAQLKINGRMVSDINDLRLYDVGNVEYINIVRTTDWRKESDREDNIGINLPNYPYRIEIILKEGINTERDFTVYKAIGYSENAEFYHPVYDTPEKISNRIPDLRTTLYWNPYLQTGPDGKAMLEFYSGDIDTPKYEITIEGITPGGNVCRYQ